MDDLLSSFKISAAGMKVQGLRLRVIAENLANAASLPTGPGKSPYRRKNIIFENVLNRELGLNLVEVKKVGVDRSEFNSRFDPNHPAADDKGYVKTPNVNSLVEVMDMREAQRSYEANVEAIRSSRSMLMRTIGLLRGR